MFLFFLFSFFPHFWLLKSMVLAILFASVLYGLWLCTVWKNLFPQKNDKSPVNSVGASFYLCVWEEVGAVFWSGCCKWVCASETRWSLWFRLPAYLFDSKLLFFFSVFKKGDLLYMAIPSRTSLPTPISMTVQHVSLKRFSFSAVWCLLAEYPEPCSHSTSKNRVGMGSCLKWNLKLILNICSWAKQGHTEKGLQVLLTASDRLGAWGCSKGKKRQSKSKPV